MNQQALGDYLEMAARERMQLGGLDCVRFVIGGILAGWGKDFRDCLRYQCRRSAVMQLREDGGLREAFSKVLGEPVPRHELEPGDIAYFPDGFVGLVLPGYIAVKYRRTIMRVPLERCGQGWKWARS